MTESDYAIQLEALTKEFPGMDRPAVDRLSMEVPTGEIVVLVGPSGCGKTTAMKLVNRLIEPTSGRVFVNGDDVMAMDGTELRRGIGYVIQEVGLFPHKTIFQNVATVPRVLGWEDEQIAERVDELLELVGVPADEYRDRYPKELSGGQVQRVGVARALAADPPVMLMDEPFGAIDPITREALQDEFLRLQDELHKTILFVTHDIDEAIKMGDRIAILRENSHIAQFDTPEQILVAPTDEFVSDFIGGQASLKRLNLTRVADLDLDDVPVASEDDSREAMRERLGDDDYLLVVDGARRPRGWLNAEDLDRDDPLSRINPDDLAKVESRARVLRSVNDLLTSPAGVTVVVDDDGGYRGVVTVDAVVDKIQAQRQEAGL